MSFHQDITQYCPHATPLTHILKFSISWWLQPRMQLIFTLPTFLQVSGPADHLCLFLDHQWDNQEEFCDDQQAQEDEDSFLKKYLNHHGGPANQLFHYGTDTHIFQLCLGNTCSWKHSCGKQLLLSSFKSPFWLEVVCQDVTEHRQCWLGSFVATTGKKLSKKWTVPVPAQPQCSGHQWSGKTLLLHGQEATQTRAVMNQGRWLEQMK